MNYTQRFIRIVDVLVREQPDEPHCTRVIEVEVRYNEGGTNMFTSKQEPRGYFLHVTPVVIEKLPGSQFTGRRYGAFSGTKLHIEDATRFNRKRLEVLALAAQSHPRYDEVVAHVCTKNGLTLGLPVSEVK